MSRELNLKEIERKAWRSTFQDGLVDIMLGFILLAMGLTAWLDRIVPTSLWADLSYGLLLAVGMAIFLLGKRLVTIPRIGQVNFGPRGRTRHRRSIIILSLSAVIGLLAWFLADGLTSGSFTLSLESRIFFPALFAVNALLVFGSMAYFLDYPRLYLIAVLYALAMPLREILLSLGVAANPLGFVIPALIIIALGISSLVKFMRMYPIVNEGNDGRS